MPKSLAPADDSSKEPGPSDFLRRIQAHLVFRLLAAVFILVVTLLFQFRLRGNLLAPPLTPLYLFSAILFLVTLVGAGMLRFIQVTPTFAAAQFVIDILAVTILIFLSGGVESPFGFLYIPVIITAALFFYQRGAFWAAAASSVAYGAMLDLQYFGWIRPLQFLPGMHFSRGNENYFYILSLTLAAFFLVAFLSGHLAAQLRRSLQEARERKKKLEWMEDSYRTIVERMGAGLLILDGSGIVRFANRTSHLLLGAPPGALVGRSLESVDRRLYEMVREVEEAGKEGAASDLETLYPREVTVGASGTIQRSLLVCLTQLGEGSEADGGERIVLLLDQTRLKAMEEHVRRLEQLAFAGKMAGEIVHEIKNPLAVVSGVAEMLEMGGAADASTRRLNEMLRREIDRINNLVTRYLWLAREARDGEGAQPVSVRDAVEQVVEALRDSKHLSSSHEIQLDVDPKTRVQMPPRHLHQILWHLLANAAEAQPGGGVIRVEARRESGAHHPRIQLRISDTGPGIDPAHGPRIFEPHFTTKDGHMGLGLSIVYRLVEEAGGHIRLASDPVFSTTFVLILPTA
ncbi:two-component system, NtrC family, sensor histidine kinase PilS [Desulfacinum hydrothermale DSM 13146]|uniref:histidine kinase n=1 Tax=Desulfacinum hydrothermale DSM 13146 TaxID=1121390 RepID=A0A1W1X6V3_9BACT|nr:ATP-binding protein [Desulfacinum hydrothermale]SMC19553.1 two-component system, NtrC family, sensor histidine kinase PilS [Desulfacinum hydrothermale DSM 13146]